MNSKWATRVIEGLLIGFGAAISFYIFNSMVEATNTLDGAQKRLVNQDKLNKDLGDITLLHTKEIEQVKEELLKQINNTNEKINKLSTELSQNSKTNGTSTPEIDWSKFNLEYKLPTNQGLEIFKIPNINSKFELPDNAEFKINKNIDELINIQKEIPLK
ncbi:MAG: hypothetical protein GY799_30320 [Desulfobulbaceae bacterium]|nr:hypothetical protein [Desulfobulbaceae bacterium]